MSLILYNLAKFLDNNMLPQTMSNTYTNCKLTSLLNIFENNSPWRYSSCRTSNSRPNVVLSPAASDFSVFSYMLVLLLYEADSISICIWAFLKRIQTCTKSFLVEIFLSHWFNYKLKKSRLMQCSLDENRTGILPCGKQERSEVLITKMWREYNICNFVWFFLTYLNILFNKKLQASFCYSVI